VPPTVLEAATKLKLYIFPGVGVQNLIEPFRALNEQRRITLANCHGNTCSAAQHAVALMLALTNHLVR